MDLNLYAGYPFSEIGKVRSPSTSLLFLFYFRMQNGRVKTSETLKPRKHICIHMRMCLRKFSMFRFSLRITIIYTDNPFILIPFTIIFTVRPVYIWTFSYSKHPSHETFFSFRFHSGIFMCTKHKNPNRGENGFWILERLKSRPALFRLLHTIYSAMYLCECV